MSIRKEGLCFNCDEKFSKGHKCSNKFLHPFGLSSSETLRLVGRISTQKVLILIDRGSTHNFVQQHLVHTLGLHAQPTHSLRVMVGNGNEIECYHLYAVVTVHV